MLSARLGTGDKTQGHVTYIANVSSIPDYQFVTCEFQIVGKNIYKNSFLLVILFRLRSCNQFVYIFVAKQNLQF